MATDEKHSDGSEKQSHEHLESADTPAYGSHAQLTPEQKQQRLTEALAADPGIKGWTWRAVKFYLVVLCITCCSGDSGFDGTVMSGINAMKQYQRYFDLKQASARTGIIFGIYTVGNLVGMVPAAILPDKVGRRWSMLLGNVVLISGAILTANATHRGTFIGGRFLTGVGVSSAGAAAKSYLAEITPPQTRGRYLGILNSFFYVGQMTATGMMVATGRYSSDWSWRLPLYVQVVPAAINVACILLCPESPRWLFSVGKAKEAREVLARLHSETGDINSPLIQLEMEEIEEKVQIDGSDKRWWDWRPLFRTHADRYRSGMVVLIGTFGQLSGNGMITYFLTILLEQAGIVSQDRQLTLNFVNSVTSFVGALTGSFLVDHFGRRNLLLTSTGLMVVCLAATTGLLSNPGASVTRANAGISFIYLFMVIFSFGWTPMQALYPAEVLNYQTRAKGLAFLVFIAQASSCINTFGLPVALGAIGWRVYLIFTLWDVFEFAVIYFTLVETKGLTLEEVDEVFNQPNPMKYSLEHKFRFKAATKSTVPSTAISGGGVESK